MDSERNEPALLRGIDRISDVTGYISGVLIFVATLVICYAVVLRALGGSTIWQTELTIYLLMFVTFVGGAYGLKHQHHVNVDLLINRLPARWRNICELVASILSLALLLVVLWKSSVAWWYGTTLEWRTGTAWNPPLTFPYAILPVGMALVSLQYVAVVIRKFRELKGQPLHGPANTGDGTTPSAGE